MTERQRQRQRSTPARPAGAALAERLAVRRPEIEEAVLARVFSVSDPAASPDPAYLDGLRKAVLSALEYGIAAIEGQSPEPGPIPTELLGQARHAARNGVGLATVLRRYFAGYSVLSDFLIGEAEAGDLLGAEEFQRLSRAQAELFDRIIDAVASEHRSESKAKSRSRHQQRAECVKRLLAGELADTSELDYDLHAWHIGLVTTGAGAEAGIRHLAATLDRRLLMVSKGGGTFWAWLGGRCKVDAEEFEQMARTSLPAEISLAVGEPAERLAGWRLTHHQAGAALPIALRSPGRLIRYADVSLLASMLKDEVLIGSLRDLYLKPLMGERDEGETLRATLRAYFAAGRNLTSTAAVLKVSRQTVSNRLCVVEERIGRPLNAIATEIDAALRLQALDEV